MNKRLITIVVSMMVVAILTIAGGYMYSAYRVNKDHVRIEEQVSALTSCFSLGDLLCVRNLLSSKTAQHITDEELRQLIAEGTSRSYYSHILLQKGLELHFTLGILGTSYYTYRGEVTYDDGRSGSIVATLVKEKDTYKFVSFFVGEK
jgi:hypothetical protein